jgi:hypothetical protein
MDNTSISTLPTSSARLLDSGVSWLIVSRILPERAMPWKIASIALTDIFRDSHVQPLAPFFSAWRQALLDLYRGA